MKRPAEPSKDVVDAFVDAAVAWREAMGGDDARAANRHRLFATEGTRSQVLLSVVAFVKKTRKTPQGELDLAESRLAQWRARGKARKH